MTTETDALETELRSQANIARICNARLRADLLERAADALAQRDAEIARLQAALTERDADAERYRMVRRGQKWSVIDGIGNTLRAEELDAAADAAIAAQSEHTPAPTERHPMICISCGEHLSEHDGNRCRVAQPTGPEAG